ncbi:MAG: ATP-binding protein [Promethearchaeota archaeon]
MVEKEKKSVSNLLDKQYGKINYSGRRGRAIHEAYSKYYKKIFKTPDRNRKLNYRVFSERLTKAKADILVNIKMNSDFELYHEDVKVLLNSLHKEIRKVAKQLAKENYCIIVPKDIEIELFGGESSFEVEAIGKIGGLEIPAQLDCLIEIDSENFIVRDFKSYDRENEDDPMNPKSQHHRAFMQVCLYAIIFEKFRYQRCKTIQLAYFPNKIISYDFTDELKEVAKRFAMDTAFDGFEGINFQFSIVDENQIEEQVAIGRTTATTPPEFPSVEQTSDFHDDDSLGWINTIKGKPLQLIMGQDNKMEGFLYPNKAHRIKVGYCVIVEKEDDGVRIMCITKKIECSEDCFPGETSSHKEENYKITLIPEGQFTPEGYHDLLPQTVIGGKIKIPTNEEFCEFKKIPQNGLSIGNIQGLNTGIPYPLEIKTLYQSVFMSGQQGTGKTSSLKSMALQIAQVMNAPAQIILDNEGEYSDLRDIPTNKNAEYVMRTHGIKELELGHFRLINIDTKGGYCLTLKAIDPVDLPYFLHELTAISHDTLQTIIYDIIEDHKEQDFTLLELVKLIIKYMENKKYGATDGTKKAIMRAMTSISLRIFDVPGVKPIDFESILVSGRVTVINTYNLRDSHQRIVGLYLLAMLHKRALKGKEKINVVFFLDEIQRLIPKSKSTSDSEYQKRIIKFLDEVVHRGRKRDYGVVFATQSVSDVKKEIIDLCNTKVFFQTQGSGINYIKEYFSNKEDLERLKKLPVGQAFITSKGKHEPVEVKFPNIN